LPSAVQDTTRRQSYHANDFISLRYRQRKASCAISMTGMTCQSLRREMDKIFDVSGATLDALRAESPGAAARRRHGWLRRRILATGCLSRVPDQCCREPALPFRMHCS
jgi:hypothetical protein